jgi:hypothetical protein
MAAGFVQIPWYATGFRADALEEALAQIAAIAMRYGARSYVVYRMREDRYRFNQIAEFESKLDFERYWYGEEFVEWRTAHSSWYQIPVIYGWSDRVTVGSLDAAALEPAEQ